MATRVHTPYEDKSEREQDFMKFVELCFRHKAGFHCLSMRGTQARLLLSQLAAVSFLLTLNLYFYFDGYVSNALFPED